MGDLFGSFAESTCAALVLAASSPDLRGSWCGQMYPVLISSVGIVVGILTLMLQGIFYKVKDMPDVEKALKGILVISTVLMTPVVVFLSKWCLPESFSMGVGYEDVKWWYCAVSIMLGLWSGLIVGVPLKDTSGPALNIVMKLTAIISLVFGTAIAEFSNADGGPFWA